MHDLLPLQFSDFHNFFSGHERSSELFLRKQGIKSVNYFHVKAPSQIFDRVLSTPLQLYVSIIFRRINLRHTFRQPLYFEQMVMGFKNLLLCDHTKLVQQGRDHLQISLLIFSKFKRNLETIPKKIYLLNLLSGRIQC